MLQKMLEGQDTKCGEEECNESLPAFAFPAGSIRSLRGTSNTHSVERDRERERKEVPSPLTRNKIIFLSFIRHNRGYTSSRKLCGKHRESCFLCTPVSSSDGFIRQPADATILSYPFFLPYNIALHEYGTFRHVHVSGRGLRVSKHTQPDSVAAANEPSLGSPPLLQTRFP